MVISWPTVRPGGSGAGGGGGGGVAACAIPVSRMAGSIGIIAEPPMVRAALPPPSASPPSGSAHPPRAWVGRGSGRAIGPEGGIAAHADVHGHGRSLRRRSIQFHPPAILKAGLGRGALVVGGG